METLGALWLPIVLSAVLVFFASSVIWQVLAGHKWHVKGLPDEAAALEALGKQGLGPGQYVFPYSADPKAMKDPAFLEKIKKGPAGLLVIRSGESISIGRSLTLWSIYLLVVGGLVAFVCGQAVPAGASYMHVFRVAGAVAFGAYSFAHVSNAIWWGRPWKSVGKEIVDGLIYALLTAGSFGWLWPR